MGSISSVDHKQNGCYRANAMLDCPLYRDASSMVLKWRFQDKSTGIWERLATVKRGRQRIFPVNTNLHGRFTVHSNGSLEIVSLHPDDETLYHCIVMQRGDREAHLIELIVTCGNVSEVKREVCVEEDAVLDCDAKLRANPRKIKQVTWKKKTNLDGGSKYSKVATLSGSTVEVDDGFKLHGNGSLLLQKGREEGDDMYRCEVSKTDGSRAETHFIRVTNMKCHKETLKPDAFQTAKGDVTRTRTKAGDVAMETGNRTNAPTTQSGSVRRSDVPSQNTIVCGGALSSVAGSFQSPNFPSAYPANSRCNWTISVPQGYAAINITLHHLNFEPEKNCRYDYLSAYDKLGNQVGCRHCGYYRKALQLQVKGSQVTVVFRSDGSVQKTGFKATYKSVLL